jgi:hypothetical protein
MNFAGPTTQRGHADQQRQHAAEGQAQSGGYFQIVHCFSFYRGTACRFTTEIRTQA